MNFYKTGKKGNAPKKRTPFRGKFINSTTRRNSENSASGLDSDGMKLSSTKARNIKEDKPKKTYARGTSSRTQKTKLEEQASSNYAKRKASEESRSRTSKPKPKNRLQFNHRD